MKIVQSIVALFCIFSIHSIYAQDTPQIAKRSYTTKAIVNELPTIDGVLDEEAWNLVEWTTDYIEFEPDVSTAPTEQTKMKIIYDDKNLYVAFKCYIKQIL